MNNKWLISYSHSLLLIDILCRFRINEGDKKDWQLVMMIISNPSFVRRFLFYLQKHRFSSFSLLFLPFMCFRTHSTDYVNILLNNLKAMDEKGCERNEQKLKKTYKHHI